MKCFSVGHLSDLALVRETRECVARDRENTAALLARLGEVDARRLYAGTKYDSMFAWCVGELHLSEDAAARRLTVARRARRYPVLLEAIADGRLHLSGAGLLAPHLTPENCAELLAAATRCSKARIEQLLADRFPRPDLPAMLATLVALPAAPAPAPASGSEAPGVTGPGAPTTGESVAPTGPSSASTHAAGGIGTSAQHVPGRVEVQTLSAAAGQVAAHASSAAVAGRWPTRARLQPLSPGRYGLQVTLDQRSHDLLLEARALLGHAVPSGDLAEVFERALEALVEKLAKRRFGAGRRPCENRQGPARRAKRTLVPNERHVPDRVKNAVWEHDGGRCTFVDASGQRCEAKTRLEFDHVIPVARGGLSTASNLRLRCRTHNQFEARRVFGGAFVESRLEKAREPRAPRTGVPQTPPS